MKASRFLAALVLGAILFQGLGQSGLLKYLYEQRHVIAFSLRLTDEKVISECGSRYLAEGTLVIQSTGDSAALPAVYAGDLHYILMPPAIACSLPLHENISAHRGMTRYVPLFSSPSLPDVFRPPLV